MRKTENNVLRVLVGVFFILLFTFNVNSWVVVNGSEKGFNLDYQEELEDEILVGAANFLDSYSETLNFFRRIELAKLVQLDFNELKIFIDKAVFKMENARDAYTRLNQKATTASYDLKIINRLVVFDFGNFQNDRGLNKERFSEVSSFLSQGDVRGVYNKILIRVEALLSTLYGVKNTIDSGNIPEIPILWNLNRLYSRTIIFGQQVAKVFYQVTGK